MLYLLVHDCFLYYITKLLLFPLKTIFVYKKYDHFCFVEFNLLDLCYNFQKEDYIMKSKFTHEERQAILDRYLLKSESPTSIIESVGISKSTFYKWLSDYKSEQTEAKRKGLTLRNFNLLESKVKRLEGIIEIIKKANVLPNSPLQQKLYVAEKLSSEYSVHMICDALDIARGTYYNHILRNKRDNTWYAKRREALRIQIQEVFDENSQIFGARKITAVLRNKGVKVGEAMVRELMNDMGLTSIRQEAKKLYTDEIQRHKNYLNQEFDPDAPNQVWVSDVTYFKCNGKSYYICVIIDLYARKVIAYKVGNKNSTQLIKTTFKKAYESRQPQSSLMFHTDRGANYCSKTLNDYIKALGITRSFSRPYVPYDNSVIESFFASLKREELYRKKYRTEGELLQAIDDYMDFYNTRRPHAKIQYKTPEQKEREYSAILENFDNE